MTHPRTTPRRGQSEKGNGCDQLLAGGPRSVADERDAQSVEAAARITHAASKPGGMTPIADGSAA